MLFYLQSDFFSFVPGKLESDGIDGFFELVFNYADGRFLIFTLQMLDGSVDEAFTAFQALCFKYEALNPV